MRDELLGYYERELVFLRKMGADFARKYPKVASRLLLDEEKIEDPHVERMIEAFAFLAGRISIKLEDELPEITESFLSVIYPHYLSPIPSMAIAQMTYGLSDDKLTAVQNIKRGTSLSSRPVDGTACRFRTAYETELFPIEIIDAGFESNAPKDARGVYADAAIRISMKCYGDAALSELTKGDSGEPPESVRFFLNGDPQLVFPLYELILNQSSSVEFRATEDPVGVNTGNTITNIQLNLPDPVILTPDNIKPVGFAEDEAVLPYTKRSFPGYRLLTEYFAFPYKFLFLDIFGLDLAVARKFGNRFDILIHLKDVTPPTAPVTTDTLRMGCTPIVNLFSRTSDPIYLSQQKYEYQIIPDVHRQTTTEIYSVDDVVSTDPRTSTSREYSPFYSLKHTYTEKQEKAFWYTSRRNSQRDNDEGTEVFLNLVDSAFNPKVPAAEVLTIRTTCTNRDLASKLPFGGKQNDFEIESAVMISSVRCLTKPTETLRPARKRSIQWRLISHLNLNYLSLIDNESGDPEALREILALYNFRDDAATRNQILGIKSVTSQVVVRRIGRRVGTGFVQGLETTVEFDEELYVGSGMFLFASVLERFMSAYASINSFNQLVLRSEQRDEEVKRWAPRAAEQQLL